MVNFSRFHAATHISITALKSLKIDEDSLRMKFSALNVDFNSASFDP